MIIFLFGIVLVFVLITLSILSYYISFLIKNFFLKTNSIEEKDKNIQEKIILSSKLLKIISILMIIICIFIIFLLIYFGVNLYEDTKKPELYEKVLENLMLER